MMASKDKEISDLHASLSEANSSYGEMRRAYFDLKEELELQKRAHAGSVKDLSTGLEACRKRRKELEAEVAKLRALINETYDRQNG